MSLGRRDDKGLQCGSSAAFADSNSFLAIKQKFNSCLFQRLLQVAQRPRVRSRSALLETGDCSSRYASLRGKSILTHAEPCPRTSDLEAVNHILTILLI